MVRVLIRPVSEETIDESVESLYELWFIEPLLRYRRCILTYIELIFKSDIDPGECDCPYCSVHRLLKSAFR